MEFSYEMDKNIFGEPLKSCCNKPLTGYFRDGYCRTDKSDYGSHTICVIVTKEFLEFSKRNGNDLITPQPKYLFPGLKAGDKWCLCASRWQEALEAGCAPKVELEATDEKALQIIKMKDKATMKNFPPLKHLAGDGQGVSKKQLNLLLSLNKNKLCGIIPRANNTEI